MVDSLNNSSLRILNQFHNFADSAAARGLRLAIIPCCSLLVAWLVAALDLILGVTRGEGAGVISCRGVRHEPCRGEGAATRGRGEAGGGLPAQPGAPGAEQLRCGCALVTFEFDLVWAFYNVTLWPDCCKNFPLNVENLSAYFYLDSSDQSTKLHHPSPI